ncbi:MAG: sugar transferase [Pseudomonadota bacterium]
MYVIYDRPASVALAQHNLGDGRIRARIKRVADIVVSGAALVFLAPLLFVLWIIVRLDGHEGLFRQTRVGRGGHAFYCLKYRTMAPDAEARLEAVLKADSAAAVQWAMYQKLADDPRITPVGRFLRKTNLDELPQLWNIFCGDMSLIGPRPILFKQVEAYGLAIESYVKFRPGLSGLWQVSGRNNTTFAQRARLDQIYADNWSLAGDFIILLRTMREVLFSSGS